MPACYNGSSYTIRLAPKGCVIIMQDAVLVATSAVLVYMLLWFIVSLVLKRNDVADIAWGGGFIVVALAVLVSRGVATDRAILVVTLVTIWGLRLALHIGLRNRGKGEDARYRKWREEWGKASCSAPFFRYMCYRSVAAGDIAPVVRPSRHRTRRLRSWTCWELLSGLRLPVRGGRGPAAPAVQEDPGNKGRIITIGLCGLAGTRTTSAR